ncbi:MAG: transporter substrate-binding domain-containing protein, partial [Fervidobacterium sp.]
MEKRLIFKIVVLVLLTSLVTLSFTQSLAEIKKRGKLLVGTEPTFPPFEFVDEKNQVVGFDIDIANELAKRLGVKVEIVNLPFDSLIPALQQGKVDIIIAGMTITEERAKVVDFSKPYFEANQAIVVRKDGKFEPKKIEELVAIGGTQVMLQGGLHPEYTLHHYIEMVKTVKKHYPQIYLHSFSPS